MTHSTDVRAGPLPRGIARGLVHWVCTSNPFDVISAGLFLAGWWISFGDPKESTNTWALMSGLGGYTLLLALTAFLWVRYAKVWDDARIKLSAGASRAATAALGN